MENIDFSQINFITVGAVYFAGVLTSFTPCLYPIIPVTVGFIGAKSAGSRAKAFTLSLSYVFGLALVYSALGLFAVLSGSLFGAINSHPLTLFVMANIYILLALWMMDVFSIRLPFQQGASDISHRGGNGIATAFLIGASAAFVAGPCTAPVLGALLMWIAQAEQNALLGAFFMFTFSLGLGTLLIFIGTFAGLAAHLPKSGPWLKGVKIFFGLIILGAAEYFLIQAGKALF